MKSSKNSATLFRNWPASITLLSIAIAFGGQSIHAANFTSAIPGKNTSADWNVGATWGNAGDDVEGSGFPGENDDVTIIDGDHVFIPAGLAASAATVDISGGTSANGTALLTMGAETASLAVSGTMIIRQTSSNLTAQCDLKIQAGTVTVDGLITLQGTVNNGGRRCGIQISTGTLNANGGITIDDAINPGSKRITVATGGSTGTINLKGVLTGAASAMLTPGSSGTFAYLDSGSQTVVSFGSGNYKNLTSSNPANTTKFALGLGTIAASEKIVVTATLTIDSGSLGFSDFIFTDLGGIENGTYTLISYNALNGSLALDGGDLSGAVGSATGTLQVNGNSIEMVIADASSPYDSWIENTVFANPSLLPDAASKLPAADPDSDGIDNTGEFAHDGDPTDPTNNGKVLLVTADGDDSPDTQNELILTMAVRVGEGEAFVGATSKSATRDGVNYTVEGSLSLDTFDETTLNQSVAVTPTGGLPALSSADWEWKSFSLSGSNGLSNRGFLRSIAEMP